MMRGDTSALPPALSCGVRASCESGVVRLTGGFHARGRTVRPVPGNVLQDMWGSNPHRAPQPKQQRSSGALARPAWKAEAATALACAATRVARCGKTPRSCATGIQHSENAGKLGGQYPPWKCTVTRPKLTVDRTRTSGAVCARAGESRRRDFAAWRESSCTLVAEQSAHLSAARARHRGTSDVGVGEFAPSLIVSAQVGLVAFEQRCPACTLRGRAVVARRPHKPQVEGSIPSLATRSAADAKTATFVVSNGCDQSRVAQQGRKTPGLRSQDTALAVCTVDLLTAGETASDAETARAALTEGSRPSRSAARRLAMVRGETPRQGVSARHDTAKRFVSLALGGAS